ncbi:MAG TPA: phosphoenolpyruvate--protein phosphotransferase [Usitatibacter sp.]|nr:phosphoenolpyruvate--protein phosphotransferase [Usitatibacter sp.]
MSRIAIAAPLSGWCLPLAEVPDPVFAQGMAGDGLAIDPVEGVVLAPCEGEIVAMNDARHAVTVRHANGVEILVHVGIDTVELRGAGFESVAAAGARVRTGDLLLRFDLDFLARHAKSLATPVVVAAGGTIVRRAPAGRIAAGELLVEVDAGVPARDASPGDAQERSRSLAVPFEHGLHVRPAAQIASALRPFSAQVRLTARGREANARSPVAMMALGLRRGDTIVAIARGADAAAALDALETLLGPAAAPASGETPARPGAAHAPKDPPSGSASMPSPTGKHRPAAPPVPARIEGAIASRGVALGPCVHAASPDREVERRGTGVEREASALESALASVVAHLERLRMDARGEAQALLAAHVEIAADPELRARADERVRGGDSAAHAWRHATRATADVLASLDDERMRARAADLLDLERQVLRALEGEAPEATRDFPAGSIVVADEILPSQFLALERAGVAGIVTARGGATSHMAILAAAAGIPALVAAGDAVVAIAPGTRLALDAEHGWVDVDPPAAQWSDFTRAAARREAERGEDRKHASEPARTSDGERIVVNANLGTAADARAAVALGAEGCGLLRTEFLYLDRRDAPGVEEQAREYQAIAEALGGRPLTIRTMDIGGDKPIAYLPLPREENPALGLRGVRASLLHPALLRTQLAAILAVRPESAVRILVPMVTDVSEIRFVRAALAEAMREARRATAPLVGAMIETPASALLAAELARECDFLSIGTNDLSQYVLAIDRAHPRLAARLDALHPAVLRLLAGVAQAAAAHAKTASICGALASDLEALPILVGLGLREISATSAAIPALKRVARACDSRECAALASRALERSTAEEVRELLREARARRGSTIPIGG